LDCTDNRQYYHYYCSNTTLLFPWLCPWAKR